MKLGLTDIVQCSCAMYASGNYDCASKVRGCIGIERMELSAPGAERLVARSAREAPRRKDAIQGSCREPPANGVLGRASLSCVPA